MKFQLQIDGLEEASEKVRRAPELLKEYLLAGFVDSAAIVARRAETLAPKRTGELAGSMLIDVKDRPDGYTVSVGPSAFYAGWVEYGHRVGKRGERVQARLRRALGVTGAQVPAHPYFFPAVEQSLAEISAAIREAVARAEEESSSP